LGVPYRLGRFLSTRECTTAVISLEEPQYWLALCWRSRATSS
jgi:hypothetical protein